MSETALRSEPADQTPAAEPILTVGSATAPALGVIGLGPAGRAAALALLRAGKAPLACDTDADRCRDYAEAAGPDADITDDPEEVGRRCTIVLLALEIGADASTIHGALQATLAPGSLIIDMGPALPGDLRRMAEELEPRGLHLVDAPILPGKPAIVLVGGGIASVHMATDLLEVLGTCVPTGKVGTAQALAALIAELDARPGIGRIRELAGQ